MIYLAKSTQSELIIDKSRFITNLYVVTQIDDVHTYLKDIRKIHKDANHYCYAYIIRDGREVKASDDGEPAKTAGVPILEVLKHHDLTDVLCVVTRYFGGIKLGAGGLIRAYTNSVSHALSETDFLLKEKRSIAEIELPYALYDTFSYQLKDHITIIDQQFAVDIKLTVILNGITYAEIKDKFHTVKLTDLGETIVDIPLE
ncbi:MAG: YigZ family protein [Acholeplasma sp.]|nr:YigZ family protein [Acholeplasma sp.]